MGVTGILLAFASLSGCQRWNYIQKYRCIFAACLCLYMWCTVSQKPHRVTCTKTARLIEKQDRVSDTCDVHSKYSHTHTWSKNQQISVQKWGNRFSFGPSQQHGVMAVQKGFGGLDCLNIHLRGAPIITAGAPGKSETTNQHFAIKYVPHLLNQRPL